MELTFTPIQNKYTKCYFAITSYRKQNPATGYTENHHIHPESLGGSNKKDNMVRLTAREHYVCHLLLTKMLIGEPKKRMCYAFRSMHRKKQGMERYLPGSHIYKITREAMDFTPSEETRERMSAAQKKRAPATKEHCENLSKGVKASYTQELRALRAKNFSERIISDTERAGQSARNKNWAHIKDDAQREKMRKELSERMSARTGEKHARSKLWTLQSPSGEVFKTKDMTTFCAEHNVNYSSLRNRAREQSREPLGKGASKGWIVVSCV
jgi:hypothetical protein